MPNMKSIRIALSPTRNRPVNIFLGLMLALVSLLLFVAMATYHASDPSFNTAVDPALAHAARNWIGIFGAYLSDLLLQSLGITAFLLPLWTGAIAWSWMRSRASGPALLRGAGMVLALVFLPALFGLLPWHWRWLHVLPIEGVTGRLMAGLLVGYLNVQGAWIVAIVLAMTGVYFASALSINGLKEGIEDRWLRATAWHERWRNVREERAEREDLREDEADEAQVKAHHGWLGRWFGRRRKDADDLLDEVPAFQRVGVEPPEPDQKSS